MNNGEFEDYLRNFAAAAPHAELLSRAVQRAQRRRVIRTLVLAGFAVLAIAVFGAFLDFTRDAAFPGAGPVPVSASRDQGSNGVIPAYRGMLTLAYRHGGMAELETKLDSIDRSLTPVSQEYQIWGLRDSGLNR